MESKAFNPDSYWDNRLSKIQGLEGVGFKKLGPSFNKWAYRVRRHVFLKQVKVLNLNMENAQVLDIGSGTGFYIKAWSDLNCKKITGVDITPTAVNNLKNTFSGSKFYQSDIGDVNFNQEKIYENYDAISSMDVLFHIIDDQRFEQAVKNISSILKPGGYFIYSDAYLQKETVRGESQVLRTKDYLIKTFKENNLELVTMKPFMFFTDKPTDTKNPLLKLFWFCLENGLYILPFMGHILGPLIYPAEILAVDHLEKSPTSKFTIFRKK